MRLLACLVLMLAALVVAACGTDQGVSGGAGAAERGETLTLWIMNNGPDPVADTQRLVAPFERATGIGVDVELVGWDIQFDRIRNAAVSGQGPDVTQAGTTQVPFFAALGGFEDLSSQVGQIGGADAYAPGVWRTTQVAGLKGTWAVPWFTEARAIYYRKDALRAAGIDEAGAFKDWAAFRSTLEKLRELRTLAGTPISPFGAPGKKAYDLVHNVAPYLWSAGGAELSADNSRSTIADAKNVEGMRFVADLVRAGLWDKSTLARDGQQVEEQFKAGELAVWIGGPWVLASAKRASDDTWTPQARENLGVAPMPTGPSGRGYTFVGGSNLMVPAASEHKAAAWMLVKYLSSDAVQREYADLLGMFPARLEPQAAAGSVDDHHQAFYTAIKQGRSYAPIPQWGQIENAYKEGFGRILDAAARPGPFGDQTIRHELGRAQREANALLAR
jgi:multiple sugar transport system substrate-binding protein